MYKSEVTGKGCIVARVVADSIASNSCTRITTLEVEYPRFIHSELMTHRMFSRNAASSRAIPVEKMIEQVRSNPAAPIHWGANQKGMQADLEMVGSNKADSKEEWINAANSACDHAEYLASKGAHKQLVNRILEPFQIMKTVVTATEWNNFFFLRLHEDAQPEIYELARVMKQAMDESEPNRLSPGEWHLPYVQHGEGGHSIPNGENWIMPLSLDQAIKVSASCCAQVSYRLLDQSVDKAVAIYDDLVNSKPVHASPFEHQATPMQFNGHGGFVSDGCTHTSLHGNCWSGNFRDWIQHRQLIPENAVPG